jgi:hypothetical protein
MIADWQPANDKQAEARHWWQVRQAAIELGLIAERHLIAAGELSPNDRRIINRKEARADCK